MSLERLVRISLWVTDPFNLLAGFVFAMPGSALRQLLMLPESPVSFYTIFAEAMVALFGGVYIWLALQAEINKPLLSVGAIGKALAVLIALGLFFDSNFAWLPTLFISGDLVFVVLWGYFIVRRSD